MDKWQDNKDSLSVPLNWHGEDDDATQDDSVIDDDKTQIIENKDVAEGKSDVDNNKKSDKEKKSTKSKKSTDVLDDDNISDDLPEDLEGLSAQELRELIKIQGKELNKTRIIARKRLREIMEKKEKFKEIEDQKEKERIKELEEKQQYKKLYEDMKPKYDVLTKDIGKTLTYFETKLVKLTESLPEEYHKLIPEVDIRERIAWIENFKNTVLNKKDKVDDTKKENKKASTSVGDLGSPKDDPNKNKQDTKSSIETALINCKTPEELERLTQGLAKKGL